MKDLVFDVPDTPTLRLMKDVGDEFGIKLPFQLPPESSKETQFIILISDDTFAQTLRGHTYVYVRKQGKYSSGET